MSERPDVEGLTLAAGGSVALIAPALGGRLAQLDLGDGPLLRPAAPDLSWAHWGCYPLLPWSNRIPGGRFAFGGEEFQLPINWEDGSAIHGLAASTPWQVRSRAPSSVALEVDIEQSPYEVRGSLTYDLDDGTLRMALAVTNVGPRAVPAGLGIHPWFGAGPIRVPASEAWPGEPVPTGPPCPVVADDDLRTLRVPGPLDRCFTGLTGTTADAPGVRLSWSGSIEHVVVYTRVSSWVCIEPVTMATNGFAMAARGEPRHGVLTLAPDAVLSVEYHFDRRA